MDEMWNQIGYSIAKNIEKIVMPLFGTRKAGENVGTNVSGDVTKYVDRLAEDVALEALKPLPVNIVSEEIGTLDRGRDYTVVIDPIDGSYNFSVGVPVFAFSFGVFKGRKPVYGSVYEFTTGRYFEGIPGKGAYLNGERIRVKPLPPERAALSLYTRGRGTELAGMVKRIRVLGAIAVELSYLAMGSLQAVVDVRNYVRPTDIAAACIIAKEAGALVVDDGGRELRLELNAEAGNNIVAASSEELLEMILGVMKGG